MMKSTQNGEVRMNFLGHLEELRHRILYSLFALAIATIISYIFSAYLLDLVTAPLDKLKETIDLVTLRPTEGFVARLKLAFITGVFLSLPIILYHFWRFITPGLKSHEKLYFIPLIICSTLFFILGALFAYIIVLPLGLAFFHSFQTEQIVDRWSLTNYISFVGQLLLGFGVVFQMPLASFFLSGMLELSEDNFKHKKLASEEVRKLLQFATWRMEALQEWDKPSIETAFVSLAEQMELKFRDFIAPVFIAITGKSSATPVMDSMVVLGPDMSRVRLRHAVGVLGGVSKKEAKRLEKEYRALGH